MMKITTTDSDPDVGLSAQQAFCLNVLVRENKSHCSNANASSLRSFG